MRVVVLILVAVATSIALAFWATASYAGNLSELGLDDPEVSVPRGACYPVISERTGEVLYWTGNPAAGSCVTIPVDGKSTTMSDRPTTSTPNDPECEGPKDRGPKDKGPKDKGPKDKGKSKGNASANNGKGGNYDKTGHSDNGKGQGRNKK